VGTLGHLFTQMDQTIFMTRRHGVGQPTQLKSKTIKITQKRCITHQTLTIYGVLIDDTENT